jgi:hypothetical protein
VPAILVSLAYKALLHRSLAVWELEDCILDSKNNDRRNKFSVASCGPCAYWVRVPLRTDLLSGFRWPSPRELKGKLLAVEPLRKKDDA